MKDMKDMEDLENEYYQQMLKEEEMQYEHREMCLDTIKKLVSDGMFREIMEVIQEEAEGYLYDFKLTTEPLGELQQQG